MSKSETRKSELVSFHCTPEQKRKIRVTAAEQGMTISEYVRSELLD